MATDIANKRRTRTPERKEVLARRSREFYWRNREKCIAANRKSKLKYAAKVRAKRQEQAQWMRDLITQAKDVPCADCGVRYPSYVMDFDHVTGEKVFDIGHWACNKAVAAVLAEIDKCDVVCGNCHRERTHGGSRKQVA